MSPAPYLEQFDGRSAKLSLRLRQLLLLKCPNKAEFPKHFSTTWISYKYFSTCRNKIQSSWFEFKFSNGRRFKRSRTFADQVTRNLQSIHRVHSEGGVKWNSVQFRIIVLVICIVWYLRYENVLLCLTYDIFLKRMIVSKLDDNRI